MDKLKPCPFCGGEVRIISGFGGITTFICHYCGAITSFKGSEEREEAIAAWNRRCGQRGDANK